MVYAAHVGHQAIASSRIGRAPASGPQRSPAFSPDQGAEIHRLGVALGPDALSFEQRAPAVGFRVSVSSLQSGLLTDS